MELITTGGGGFNEKHYFLNRQDYDEATFLRMHPSFYGGSRKTSDVLQNET